MLGGKDDNLISANADEQRRADRFLLAVFSMSGKNSPRCKKLIRRFELELGKEEVKTVRREIDDAIHDLVPLSRPWD